MSASGRELAPGALLGWLLGRRPPPLGWARIGGLQRVAPVSASFGFDRGRPVDRYYIEGFLARHASDVRGRVLEVGDDSYTRRFGGAAVTRADVLHVTPGNPAATIVADLADAPHVPSDSFDCIVLTQTLHLVYDTAAAARTLYRILRPGGVLLVTVPGISPLDRGEWSESWYWAFTAASLRRVLVDAFGQPPTIETHGNVLAACAFLQGLADRELVPAELDVRDERYPVTVAGRVVKPAAMESGAAR